MLKRPFVILLVEDEPSDAQLFVELCQEISPDLQVHTVGHGREALTFLEQGAAGASQVPRPDLIVLDLNMPVMDGHSFLLEAKRHDHFSLIPTVVLSTSHDDRDIRRAYQQFASGYLVKPESYSEQKALVSVVTAYWHGTVRLPTLGQLNG